MKLGLLLKAAVVVVGAFAVLDPSAVEASSGLSAVCETLLAEEAALQGPEDECEESLGASPDECPWGIYSSYPYCIDDLAFYECKCQERGEDCHVATDDACFESTGCHGIFILCKGDES
jgi:hypothetical protein